MLDISGRITHCPKIIHIIIIEQMFMYVSSSALKISSTSLICSLIILVKKLIAIQKQIYQHYTKNNVQLHFPAVYHIIQS